MLRTLRIENFALIDELEIELGPGLIALTGETGAGKSIIVDALNAALGERVTSEAIRGGADRARVEATFDLSRAPAALAAAQRAGIDTAHGEIALSRTIASGRSYYRINGEPSTMADLREIGEHLADIHGQHEHQSLIHERSHRRFLDAFGGAEQLGLLKRYAKTWGELRDARGRRDRLATDERTRAQRLDLLRYQVQEIDDARLAPDEDDELAAERERLMHYEKLRDGLAAAWDALEGDGASGAVEQLRVAQATAGELAEIDPTLAPAASALVDAVEQAEDAARAMRHYLEAMQDDPERIDEVEARLNMIAGLKRKYGDTVGDILRHRDEAQAEIDELEGAAQSAEELLTRIAALEEEAGRRAEALSQSRRELAERLAGRVEEELRPLGMDRARFDVAVEADADEDGLPDAEGRRWAADAGGIDRVRFMLSANPGEALRPLSNVASGGELSRVMLVFKSICAAGTEIPTIVFDEVDANVGGRTALAVAEKLVAVSAWAQVLCITHLPQIACHADVQLSVSKSVEGDRTFVALRELTGDERVSEIARMMGQSDTATARENAAEMLAEAARTRDRVRGPSTEQLSLSER
ncbi:MAG: DNA repair protein RecN [Armatimonadota bacterium]|jgi:DNA repair protein RecN (Recombination protein N)